MPPAHATTAQHPPLGAPAPTGPAGPALVAHLPLLPQPPLPWCPCHHDPAAALTGVAHAPCSKCPKGQCNGALASPLLVDSPTLPHPRMGQSKNAMQNARGIFDLHTILYLLRHHLNPVSILLFLSIPWREQRYSQYHKWFVQMLFFCNSNGNTMASICKSYLTLTKTQR